MNKLNIILLIAITFLFGCQSLADGHPLGVVNTIAGGTVSWDANTEPDFSDYVVYFGGKSRSYTSSVHVGANTSCDFEFPAGVYFFAVTARDFSGNESPFSNEVEHEVGSVGGGPLVSVEPLVKIDWVDHIGDTLFQNLLVSDTSATKEVPLFMKIRIDRESLMVLDSLQIDFNVASGSWPVLGSVIFTKSITGHWSSSNARVSSVDSGIYHAVNARVHEANGDWFDWPEVKNYFKIEILPIGTNIIQEVVSVTIMLDIN